MKMVNVHAAKTGFSRLLAEVEKKKTRFIICRNGQPVADLIPHQAVDRLKPDKRLGALKIHYDPVEPLSPEEWPLEGQ